MKQSPKSVAIGNGPCPIRRPFLNGRMALSCVEWPRDDAPLAILIHGNRDHARSWDPIAAFLQTYYHVVAPDLRGHGDSAWSQDGRYDYSAHLSDIAALCDTLAVSEHRPVTLIGHSLGAHIALRYSAALPGQVKRLVGIEAVGAPPAMDARRGAMPLDERLRCWFDERKATALLEQRSFASIDEAAERMISRHPYLTHAQASHLTRHGVRQENGGWRWKYDPFVAVWPYPELDLEEAETLWRRIDCPTQLIFGDRSWPSDVPERLVRAIPGAQEVRLAHSGHWPQHDALDACLSAIAGFLAPE